MNRKQEPLWMNKISLVHADPGDPALHFARQTEFPLSCKAQLQALSEAACAALLTPSGSEAEESALYALGHVMAHMVDGESVKLPESLADVRFSLPTPGLVQRLRGAWQLLWTGSVQLPLVRKRSAHGG
jgi:hypothetical protein